MQVLTESKRTLLTNINAFAFIDMYLHIRTTLLRCLYLPFFVSSPFKHQPPTKWPNTLKQLVGMY